MLFLVSSSSFDSIISFSLCSFLFTQFPIFFSHPSIIPFPPASFSSCFSFPFPPLAFLLYLTRSFLRQTSLLPSISSPSPSVFPSFLPPLTTTLVGPAEDLTTYPDPNTIFTQQNNTELRSQVGTTAVLHCIAHNVGENTVSRRVRTLLVVVGGERW
ncbi:hypothetical protein E2C01_099733 [Portunus trituberculatus]|uniref:Uncharacterized protein n=1 Tax=Portunus trituberculatus TaxID=210409 RepID=A0A5B7KBG9_PORTR|nr:hypothetical protein [Portunus trituberculatus]